jgi:hypothetical protein
MSNTYDLSTELDELRDLKAGLLSMAKTDAERVRIIPQAVALSKQIQALAKDCENYKLGAGQTFSREDVMAFGKKLMAIICEECSALPNYQEWVDQLVSFTQKPEARDWILEVVGNAPDKYMLLDRIVARIEAVMAETKDEQTPDTN